MKDTMLTYFSDVFGDREEVNVYFAPGRVNLIGEHTDYNGGHVFPCALTIGTYGAVRPRKDNKLRFYSMNFKEKGIITCSLDNISYKKEDDWANYPKAVLWALTSLILLQYIRQSTGGWIFFSMVIFLMLLAYHLQQVLKF